ncbi:MAG: family 43 glycosylhydrolase [Nocardioidaceae bacterium]|nr:family 43 glycosylhydrolase [Nocardioidaceae bacterium]
MTKKSLLALALALPLLAGSQVSAAPVRDSYANPLAPKVPDDGTVDSCADPTVLRGQRPDDDYWYMYCTTDPLNDSDVDAEGNLRFHPLPMMRSRNLIDWRYLGDALPEPPEWAAEGAGIWAPDVVYSKATDRYYLTFVVTDVDDDVSNAPGCTFDNAIGVAVSRGPTGPWRTSDQPVVGPRRNPSGAECDFLWTFDPDVLGDSIGERGVLYYGSYVGGLHATRIELTREGMRARGVAQRIAVNDRYEGSNVVKRGNWYYLFASATNCCNGPLTGYSVFVGRSQSRFGPFVDREGNSFLEGRVGGTPVLSMNGNRWVGTGHNSVFRDFGGQWWTVYHAVDRFDPYFETDPGFTKRPALLDPVDWVDGWPTVRAGRWASDRRVPAPAAQPGEESRYDPHRVRAQRRGDFLPRPSAEFNGSGLGKQWTWVREPADSSSYGVENGRFRFDTQAADLYVDSNDASVLTTQAPSRNYVVQTKVRLDVPPEGCCYNFVQAGLVIYDNDDRFLKLVHVSIGETRQTEFAKEVAKAPAEYPRYGNTVVGTPGDWTFLRIVREADTTRTGAPRERYTAYTRQVGKDWVRGGTWVHHLGDTADIGLVSMGGSGFTADFANVKVWKLRPSER